VKQRTRVILLALVAGLFVLPTAPAVAAEPTLTLTAGKSVYVANQTVVLTSRVTSMNLDWSVDVSVDGGSRWTRICLARTVNNDTLRCTITAGYTFLARARLTDNQGTPKDETDDTVAKTVTRTVPVKVAIGTQPRGGVRSGKYQVYGRGASPTIRSTFYPSKSLGRCLKHQVQRHYSSGWKTVRTSSCKGPNSKGQVSWTWSGKHASGVKYRVRAKFAGDRLNRANASAWVGVRFR